MVANQLMRVIILVISNALTKLPCNIVGEEETVLRHIDPRGGGGGVAWGVREWKSHGSRGLGE